ncbi:Hpt domain-containing protein [Massilia sp. LXY-6]|uniref:Hpt domain-containing protein n=1 Tax=Massilia sp. LXY-6 TaxID=3379823 RepID=UPI003EDEC9DF
MTSTAGPLPDPAPPAIDYANGAARLMGDAALFARVLIRFRKEYRHAADAIRDALARGDVQLAQRLAHTLKGAAGMIEAVPLRQAAQALEYALRQGVDPVPQLARLGRALERVLRELDAAEGISPTPPVAQDGECGKVLARLRILLEDGNGDAVDLVQEAAAGLTRELGEERYRRVAAAIDIFDFEGALDLLER